MATNISVDNGVNTQALLDAREALSASPTGAQFTWRATCTWLHGTHSRSTVKGVELVLSGLASCLTAGVASVAQLRGIQLRSVMAKQQFPLPA
jgi:hypothetical protein